MPSVAVAGAAIMDITGKPFREIIPGDSNPGTIRISFGGVGRNIAENLARLDIPLQLITAVGDDHFGKMLLENCSQLKIQTENSLIVKEGRTAVYLAMGDRHGDLEYGLSDTAVMDYLTPGFFRSKNDILKSFEYLVIDTNLPEASISYLLNHYSSKKIFADAVSVSKAVKIREHLHRIHTLKVNKAEACLLAGISDESSDIPEKIRVSLLKMGAHRVFVTMGKDGCYFFDREQDGKIPGVVTDVINSSGAGDAFMAGLVLGSIRNEKLTNSARVAMSCALMALKSEQAVNPLTNIELIDKLLKDYF